MQQSSASENERSALKKFTDNHPNLTTAAKVTVGTGLIVGGTAVLAPALVVGALSGVGFKAAGVAGGSLAATMQGVLYGGATSGVFSLCQAMGTAAVASTSSIAAAAGSVAAGTRILQLERASGDEEGSKNKPATSSES